MTMRHYCTLFDSKYLPQGLALYESLKRHSSQPFLLDILALDHECELVLRSLDLEFVDVTSIDEFEQYVHGMKEARSNRSYREYCWTCASAFTEDILGDDAEEITYIDADVLIFSDPEPVFAEIGDRSIAITPHNFIPSKQYLDVNGLYNVGFVHFKDTQAGAQCLRKWAADVRDRCSVLVGCGDQQYLDAFPVNFPKECHVIQNIGVNAGPWSLANWTVTDGPLLDGVPLVAYHFHEYVHGERLTNYDLRQVDRDLIYAPYIEAINEAKARIESVRQLT